MALERPNPVIISVILYRLQYLLFFRHDGIVNTAEEDHPSLLN